MDGTAFYRAAAERALRSRWMGRFAECYLGVKDVNIEWYAHEQEARDAIRFLGKDLSSGTYQRHRFLKNITYHVAATNEEEKCFVRISKDNEPLVNFSYQP